MCLRIGVLLVFLSRPGFANPADLIPGQTQAVYLGSEPLDYPLTLESGDKIRAEVRQHGADAAVQVLSADDEVLLKVDNLFNQYGPEWIEFTAPQNGEYRLRIQLSYPEAPRGIVEIAYLERMDAEAAAEAEVKMQSQQQAALDWINQHAMRLDPPQTKNSAGWDSVAQGLASHRIVGLGEATHGSREFRLGTNRLIQELVSKHDYRCLVLETHPQGAQALDAFVNGKAGSAASAVRELKMWVWATEEMASLMDWLRSYVAKNKKNLRIEGVDSYNVRAAARPARDILATLGTTASARVVKDAQHWLDSPKPVAGFDARPVLSGWLELINRALKNPSLRARHADLRDARRWTRLALAGIDAQKLDDAASGGLRDLAMAETVSNLVESEPACGKVIVIAHNTHIALSAYGSQVRDPLGAHLRRLWGSEYVAWGSAFSQGQFMATDVLQGKVVSFAVDAAPADSFEGLFAQTDADNIALDLHGTTRDDLAHPWFNVPQKTRTIGGGYVATDPDAAFARTVPAETFDGMLWFRQVDATSLIKD